MELTVWPVPVFAARPARQPIPILPDPGPAIVTDAAPLVVVNCSAARVVPADTPDNPVPRAPETAMLRPSAAVSVSLFKKFVARAALTPVCADLALMAAIN